MVNLKLILAIKELVEKRNKEELQKKSKQKIPCVITKVNPLDFSLRENSIEALIESILKKSSPLHISSIIEELSKLGWQSQSKYHVYSSVYSSIRKNYHLFQKVGKATFQLRSALFKEQAVVESKPTEQQPTKSIPKFKDITKFVLGKYIKKSERPCNVFKFMKAAGFDCSYSLVYKTLKSIERKDAADKAARRAARRKERAAKDRPSVAVARCASAHRPQSEARSKKSELNLAHRSRSARMSVVRGKEPLKKEKSGLL